MKHLPGKYLFCNLKISPQKMHFKYSYDENKVYFTVWPKPSYLSQTTDLLWAGGRVSAYRIWIMVAGNLGVVRLGFVNLHLHLLF